MARKPSSPASAGAPSPKSGGASSTPASSTPASSAARRAPSRPPRLRHTFWWYAKWLVVAVQLVVFCAIVIVASAAKGLYDELQEVVPDLRVLLAKNRAEPTRVYAADGSLLAEFLTDRRQWIPLDDLKVWRNRGGTMVHEPGRLIDATLAIEDSRFYRHPGVDAKRIGGALVANLRAGGVEQGGSTITEQLVKNVYLTQSRTVSRRLNTTLISLQLERRLSKDEILEAYLNEIYYGNRAYGAQAASEIYFGKNAKDLSISEAALLAGLPQSPSRHDPFRNFESARRRQRVVLREMFDNQRINWGQYQEALKDTDIEQRLQKQAKAVAAERAKIPVWRAPYFVSYVRSYLQRQYGYDLDEPGLRVYTTLDPQIQGIAERQLRNGLAQRDSSLQGALVSIDPWTGHVVAMVGGRDYYDQKMNGQFNRAVQSRRQPGSTMKPYIYAAAMEAGMTADTMMQDSQLFVCAEGECTAEERAEANRKHAQALRRRRSGPPPVNDAHEIRNYDRRNYGSMPLRRAMATSNNVVATRLMFRVGIQNVIQKAHLMGVGSPLKPVPTLALGVSELTLLEHTSAFGVFATKGLRAEPTPVVRVANYAGDVLLEQPMPVRAARVLSPAAAEEMHRLLRAVVTEGTGRSVQFGDVELIGKTGTTSSNRDIWFMGASSHLSTGVWMGYDQPRNLGPNAAGGRWCGPVFREFMQQALPIWQNREPMERLVEDARATAQQRFLAQQQRQYVQVRLCRESGMLATPNCRDTIIETFSSAGGAPTISCELHTAPAPRALGSGADSRRRESAPAPARETLSRDEQTARDLNAQAQREYLRELEEEERALQGFETPPVRQSEPERAPRRDGSRAPRPENDGVTVLGEGGAWMPEEAQPQTLDDFGSPTRR